MLAPSTRRFDDCERIAGYRSCSRCCTNRTARDLQDAQNAGPDVSRLHPLLQTQWDHAANKHLGPITIKPYIIRKVWWQCDQCPDGHLHSWAARVSSRSEGQGCPLCSGRKVCKHNTLATKAPLIAAEWHSTNNALSPKDIVALSSFCAVWQCLACSHVWTTSVKHRVRDGTGCPVCRRFAGRAKKRRPSLADSNHPLLAEWDHSRNAALGISPNTVTLGSSKKVFWLCSKCPAGQVHSYLATPKRRSQKQFPTGCPFCSGLKACKCNSLQTHYPQFASEWDLVKNKGTPDDHTAHSTYVAWWTSPLRQSWQQSIVTRTGVADRNKQRWLVKQHGL